MTDGFLNDAKLGQRPRAGEEQLEGKRAEGLGRRMDWGGIGGTSGLEGDSFSRTKGELGIAGGGAGVAR